MRKYLPEEHNSGMEQRSGKFRLTAVAEQTVRILVRHRCVLLAISASGALITLICRLAVQWLLGRKYTGTRLGLGIRLAQSALACWVVVSLIVTVHRVLEGEPPVSARVGLREGLRHWWDGLVCFAMFYAFLLMGLFLWVTVVSGEPVVCLPARLHLPRPGGR